MSMKYGLITTPNCREKLLEKLKVGETATVNPWQTLTGVTDNLPHILTEIQMVMGLLQMWQCYTTFQSLTASQNADNLSSSSNLRPM